MKFSLGGRSMEKFKVKIKGRIILFSIMSLIAVLLGAYNSLYLSNSGNETMSEGIVSGFQFGLILGIGMLSLIHMIKLNMIIKDDKKLKVLYNKEQDERMQSIRSKAGMPMLMITSIMMLTAAIIAGYYNIVVFYTLITVAIIQLSMGAIVKLFCIKTM
jgi:hypothetical protein